MRNIDPDITAAEVGNIQLPRHQIILEDSIIKFSTKDASLTNASLIDSIPASIQNLSSTSNHAWATFCINVGGVGWIYAKYLRVNESADWSMSSDSATTVVLANNCQRPGFYSNGSTVYIYYPSINLTTSSLQIKRKNITSLTSNPISLASAENFGPSVYFSYVFTTGNTDKSLNKLRTVKAVMPVSSGVIVLTTEHNEGSKSIHGGFYYITSSSATKLKTTFTGDVAGSITDITDAPSYAHACAYEEDGEIFVFFNTNESGRAAYFTIKNGIESEIKPVIPIDKEDSTHNFLCNSITKINSLYVLTGRVSFKNSDDTLTGFDAYLTSEDIKNWSLGERNSFIALADAKGKMVLVNDYLYYLGEKYWARAVPNREFAPSASTITSYDITNRVIDWDIDEKSNEATSLSLNLNNQDLYFNSGDPSTANSITIKSGQGSVLSTIGVFNIDSKSQEYSIDGIQIRSLSCRDVAMSRLNDWQSPVDMWLDGAFRFRTDLTTSDGMIIKSENVDDVGTFTTGDNFKYTGINVPYLMLFDAPYSESSIIKTSVLMSDVDDGYHVSSIGFALGAYEDDDKNFNSLMLLVPRARGGALPLSRIPVLRKLNLTPIDTTDPEKVDTGLKYTKEISTLWRDSGSGEIPITAETTASYEYLSQFSITPDLQTDLMVRLSGNNIELYSKPRVRLSTTWAQNAEWALKTVVTVPDMERLYPEKKSYAGIATCIDTSASKDWFAQGKYGDMVTQLSSATAYNDWSRLFGTCNRAGSEDISYTVQGAEAFISYLSVGMKVRIHGVSYFTGYYEVTITEVMESGFRIDLLLPPGYLQYSTGAIYTPGAYEGDYRAPSEYPGGIPPAGQTTGTWSPTYGYETIYNYEIQVHGLIPGDFFGEVSSQNKPTPVNNSSSYITVDTGATKRAFLIEGRGALVTSDSTAMSIRHFDSDGVVHRLKSGATYSGGSYVGFDATSPLINTSKWKFIMYHGKFFNGLATSKGMPESGYVIVNNEIIRYVEYISMKRGYYPTETPQYNSMVVCPTAYAPVKSAIAGTSYIYNWKSWGGSRPGDQFDAIGDLFGTPPAGLLVEMLSKNTNSNKEDEGSANYYIKSIIPGTVSESAGIELSTPLRTSLQSPITDIDNPGDPFWSIEANRNQAPEGDMVAISGRAQFNSKKEKHDETAIVRYYPCNSDGEAPTTRILSAEYYNGLVVTNEDTVKKILAMAGVRNAVARTAFSSTNATSALTYTLTSTPAALPLQEPMGDFTLTGDFYIPGNNISSGTVSNRNELRIYFRNYYYLVIEQYVTAYDYDNGHQGTLYIRLATTSGSISSYNSEKTLESIKIRNSDSLSGSYSGSIPVTNATLTPDLSSKVNVKLSVNYNFVSVEINGKKAIDFCLDEYVTDGGSSLAYYAAGPISLSYKTNISNNSNTVIVQGIGDPASGYALRKDSTAKSAIDDILDDRHVFTRSTENGSIEFGQFWNRDYFGNLHVHLVNDKEDYSNEQIVGHLRYKSEKITTNVIDEDWIQENGYRYLSGSGSNIENSYYALREAKLVMRKQREESLTRDIEAPARLALQPEDEVDISHPNLPEGRYIITNAKITANSSSLSGSYSVRKKV